MKKFYFILTAMVSVALTSCMNEEFVGDSPGTVVANKTGAIVFGGETGNLTRSDFTGSDAAGKLNNEMKVYGVKQNRTTTTNYDKVFVNYTVKYATDKSSYAEYNDGWYYVDAVDGQVIKFWDYSSADYHFVAGSPVANFTYTLNSTTGDIQKAAITGLGGRLDATTTVASTKAPVYIADPVVMTKPTTAGTKYGEVLYSFKSMQTKVRVGIYETVPGYKITSIDFYDNQTTPDKSNYITLNSATDNYFQGGTTVGAEITYDWTTTPASYTFTYDGSSLTKQKYWKGGEFTGVKATSSAVVKANVNDLFGAEDNKDDYGYFIVMPTPSATAAAPLTLKCDYTLESLDGSTEDIIVKGATATIPAEHTKWLPNTAYTYLFKITNNTNGTTGDEGDPVGLYPITFDAVVANVTDGMVGTETTFATPSITVSQAGNVVDTETASPAVSEHGIKFVAGAIDVKAVEGTTDVTASATWSYVLLENQTFDYTKDYEHLGTSGAATTWTSGKLTSVTAGDPANTYIIKAVTTNGTAYFVLVVGKAEVGPAN
jgi:hypothetical protein